MRLPFAMASSRANNVGVDEAVLAKMIAPIFNERRQSSGVRMFVPGSDFVHIEDPAPTDVFHLPEGTAAAVNRSHPLENLPRRIRVRATVVALQPGMAMYVADP